MGIADFFNGINMAIVLTVLIFSFRNLWKVNKEHKRMSIIAGSISKHEWLLKLGMREHAVYFNASGLRTIKHDIHLCGVRIWIC